jgi:hypothetical protein
MKIYISYFLKYIVEQEFTKSNLKTSFKRTALMTLSLILYPIGFIVGGTINKFVGLIILIISLGIIGSSIYESSKDSSGLKWVNVIFKSLLFIAGLGLLIFVFMS